MTIIRWEPTRELHTVQNEIDRLFSSFFETPTHNGAGQLRRWVPATDLVESETEYVLRADLPKPEPRKPRKVAITVGSGQPAIEGAETAGGAESAPALAAA